jgi:tRNA A37 methylthiotransferase MiaB
VPQETKLRRLNEAIGLYKDVLAARNQAEVSSTHLVLVEGESRRSPGVLTGRTCTGKRVFFARESVPESCAAGHRAAARAEAEDEAAARADDEAAVNLEPGDYVAVEVTSATASALQAKPLARTSVAEFVRFHGSTVPT